VQRNRKEKRLGRILDSPDALTPRSTYTRTIRHRQVRRQEEVQHGHRASFTPHWEPRDCSRRTAAVLNQCQRRRRHLAEPVLDQCRTLEVDDARGQREAWNKLWLRLRWRVAQTMAEVGGKADAKGTEDSDCSGCCSRPEFVV
jgi:hypothetical protein